MKAHEIHHGEVLEYTPADSRSLDHHVGDKTKLPVRLINDTNERRVVQGHHIPLRVKGDIKGVSRELDNGG
ncbi:hypothetical protein TNCV_734051 [Trichonephila clavipes]|nr:hypothetical protein TNCV_734051 [Trichonephila clavipes]